MAGGGIVRDGDSWLLGDAVGSVRAVTDSAGDVTASSAYTVFGETRAAGSSMFGFAGEQSDPNTLIHLRARGYNPALGTFTAYDPVQPGGPSTAGWNHYSYSANNPTTWSDPTGQTTITKTAVVTVSVALQVALYIQLGKGIYDVLSRLLPWLWEHIKNPPFGSWPFAGDYGDDDEDDDDDTGDDWIEEAVVTITIENPTDDVEPELEPASDGAGAGDGGGADCESPYQVPFDPDNPGRPDPNGSIDTSTFTSGDPVGDGGIRNNIQFWRAWFELRPETLSASNRFKIFEANSGSGVSPRIDAEWIEAFPAHAPFEGKVLIHHHVDQGRYAIPVPGPTRVGSGGPFHGHCP